MLEFYQVWRELRILNGRLRIGSKLVNSILMRLFSVLLFLILVLASCGALVISKIKSESLLEVLVVEIFKDGGAFAWAGLVAHDTLVLESSSVFVGDELAIFCLGEVLFDFLLVTLKIFDLVNSELGSCFSGFEKCFIRDECLIGIGHDLRSILVEWNAEVFILDELKNSEFLIWDIFHFDQALFLSCYHDERGVVSQSQIMVQLSSSNVELLLQNVFVDVV